jgi:hypothetical protein
MEVYGWFSFTYTRSWPDWQQFPVSDVMDLPGRARSSLESISSLNPLCPRESDEGRRAKSVETAEVSSMSLLINGKLQSERLEEEIREGEFIRKDSQFRHWVRRPAVLPVA